MDVIFSQAKSPLDVVRVAKTLPLSQTLDVDASAGETKQRSIETEEVL